MVGDFDAKLPGPLVIVPYAEGPLPCRPSSDGFLISMGDGVEVTFFSNETRIQTVFRARGSNYAAFALDTHEAVRSLIAMNEYVVALHRLVAAAGSSANWSSSIAKAGVLGIPEISGSEPSPHAHEIPTMLMGYDEPMDIAYHCTSENGEFMGLAFPRNASEAWGPGRLVHAVTLSDARVPQLLPQALDSTDVFQANLYLARPGEDSTALRTAFSGHVGYDQYVPIVALAVMLVFSMMAAWGTLVRQGSKP